VKELHDRRDLVGLGGEHHGSRRPPISGQAVRLVDQKAVRIRYDVRLAHDLTEPALESDGERLDHLGKLTGSGVEDPRG
jgi:hypothetical protein